MKNTQSRFFCVECGREGIPILRKQCSQRERGHLKKLYCIYCQKEVNHAEIREIGGYTEEDFRLEFESGRFVDGVKRPIDKLPDCTNLQCQFNIDGKCWNDNRTKECKHKPIIIK